MTGTERLSADPPPTGSLREARQQQAAEWLLKLIAALLTEMVKCGHQPEA
jgi:hypothetical protein